LTPIRSESLQITQNPKTEPIPLVPLGGCAWSPGSSS